MKKLMLFSLVCALAGNLFAAAHWKNLTDKAWISGEKYTEADLYGRVVCVFYWNPTFNDIEKVLPRVEELWQAYKSKPCVFVSSVSGNKEEALKLIKQYKLTFPVYAGLDTADATSGTVFGFLVMSHRGKVLYGNSSDREATVWLVNALGEVGKPFTLLGDVELGKKSKYRSMEKALVLGKPTKSLIKKLKADIKKAEAKSATDAVREQASEAESILSAIDSSKSEIKEEIEGMAEFRAAEAVKLANQYIKSFPEEGAELKEKLPEWNALAKEQAKAAAEAKKEAAKKK